MKEELIIDKNYPGVWGKNGSYYLNIRKSQLFTRNLIIDGVKVTSWGYDAALDSLLVLNGGGLHGRNCKVGKLTGTGSKVFITFYERFEIEELSVSPETHLTLGCKSGVKVLQDLITSNRGKIHCQDAVILPKKLSLHPNSSVTAYGWNDDGKMLDMKEASKKGLILWERPVSYPSCYSNNLVKILR